MSSSPAAKIATNGHRPEIQIHADLHLMAMQTWEAIGKQNTVPFLFRRGNLPVRLEQDDNCKPITRELTPDRMRAEMARLIQWSIVRINQKTGEGSIETAKPPMDVVKNALSQADIPLPVLDRIVTVPIFAKNGELQTKPGYHEAARVLYVPDSFHALPVPEKPSDEEVKAAKDLIFDEMLADFPLVSEADKAHALALLLLPFIRDMITGPTPNHLIESACPGSGKGLLADVLLSPSVAGRVALVIPGTDDNEWRKRITTAMIEDRPALLIDNVNKSLDTGVLAAALTATNWEDRVLGASHSINIPIRCTWVTTANNPTLSTEITRRTIRIRLVPKTDRPWQRQDFKHESLREWCTEKRAEIVRAAHTLIQSWVAAGKVIAVEAKPLGSFEHWSRIMGSVLLHVGVRGFLGNVDDFYGDADMETKSWKMFTEMWWDKYADQGATAGSLLTIALEVDGLRISGDKEKNQKISLGRRLAKQKGRVFGAFEIVEGDYTSGAQFWKLRRA